MSSTADQLPAWLDEFHRVLKPGARARIAVPDYNNPKDRPYRDHMPDARNPTHVTATYYSMLRRLVAASPFGGSNAVFYHFWDDSEQPLATGFRWVQHPIDYQRGWVQRAVDTAPENRQGGNPLHVTSLVVDLIKALPP